MLSASQAGLNVSKNVISSARFSLLLESKCTLIAASLTASLELREAQPCLPHLSSASIQLLEKQQHSSLWSLSSAFPGVVGSLQASFSHLYHREPVVFSFQSYPV
uniref:Uncharacterized protein n=1 Tax=Zosterops lateralis melanops TaxID=1220523 RepID=A0A8D2PTW6_ZOSLA